jgi:signal transduction histidine kinase
VIRYSPNTLRVSVTDGGVDPRPTAQANGGGHGLVGMRERVTMLGGTLTVGPHRDGGFAVVADLPCI